MAFELKAVLTESGLTLTADIYNGSTSVASGIAMSEVVPGFYVGDAPALTKGSYTVLMLSSGVIKASGELNWDGAAEIDLSSHINEMHARLGLSLTHPLSQTANQISFADVTMSLTDSGGTVTVTRQ